MFSSIVNLRKRQFWLCRIPWSFLIYRYVDMFKREKLVLRMTFIMTVQQQTTSTLWGYYNTKNAFNFKQQVQDTLVSHKMYEVLQACIVMSLDFMVVKKITCLPKDYSISWKSSGTFGSQSSGLSKKLIPITTIMIVTLLQWNLSEGDWNWPIPNTNLRSLELLTFIQFQR